MSKIDPLQSYGAPSSSAIHSHPAYAHAVYNFEKFLARGKYDEARDGVLLKCQHLSALTRINYLDEIVDIARVYKMPIEEFLKWQNAAIMAEEVSNRAIQMKKELKRQTVPPTQAARIQLAALFRQAHAIDPLSFDYITDTIKTSAQAGQYKEVLQAAEDMINHHIYNVTFTNLSYAFNYIQQACHNINDEAITRRWDDIADAKMSNHRAPY